MTGERDLWRQELRLRLYDLALANIAGKIDAPVEGADRRCAEIKSRLALAEIFAAIDVERKRLIPPRYEYTRQMYEWKIGGEPFVIDDAARKVRIASLRSGIRSRRHSEEEAIEASRGVSYKDLPSIEQRAVEIVLGRRRSAKKNPTELASRLADQVRKDWIQTVPSVRRRKDRLVSVASIVRITVPILERLGGKPIMAAIPASQDPGFKKSAGMAALIATIRLSYGMVSSEHIYNVLMERTS
jgi:hypothetical protein